MNSFYRSLCKTSGLAIFQLAANARDQTVIIQTGGGNTLLMWPRSTSFTLSIIKDWVATTVAPIKRIATSGKPADMFSDGSDHLAKWMCLPSNWLADLFSPSSLLSTRVSPGGKRCACDRTPQTTSWKMANREL
jgi:hypothetical protein